ncbi:hypothetical protein [Eubacterium limosum]|uniref:SipW-cognate class signal peptide n=1 Tax=Eubacterium limosum TaxID=1736 RepID=A0ABT5URB5_EUBLI|nr:hypothetical protein [Eubacterium limosum]MCB6570241.1 hypothetical protein [Eubacterium limosum]MDE1471498.1 hypothetical protein [Eubacterium limosum]
MKKSRLGAIITSIAIIAVLTIGITLALLSATTDTKVNAFSSNKNIDIALREEAWDGYSFEDANPGNGTTAKDENDMTLGVNQAKNYMPGQTIPKNPQVKNTKEDNGVDAYVAIKVQYDKSFLAEDGISFNNNAWTLIGTAADGSQVYLYHAVLGVGNTTEALFDAVTVNPDLVPDETTGLLPDFSIRVQAYAIQSAGVDNPESTMMEFVNAN